MVTKKTPDGNSGDGNFSENLNSQVEIETTLVPLNWWKHITYTNKRGQYSDPLACLLLGEIVNPFWIKNPQGEVIGWNGTVAPQAIICDIKGWARTLKASTNQISTSLKLLIKTGMVCKGKKISAQEAKKIVCGKIPQKLEIPGTKLCEWCRCSTFMLHQHHFPIHQKDGGIETVSICANCHHEFHHLVDIPKYKISVKTISLCIDSIQGMEVE